MSLKNVAFGLRGVSHKEPVVVVGGGIAGTTVAWELHKRGVPVRLVEASGHIGGRIQTVEEGGGLVETGMQFYYGGYRQTRSLLRELGLLGDLVPIHLKGQMYWRGETHGFSKTRPWLGAMSVTQNLQLQLAVARKIGALLRMDIFDSRGEEEPHDEDVAGYFLEHGDKTILELAVRPMTTSYAFCEPEGHSLAMLLRILKLGALSGTYGLRGGNASLPQAMSRRLDVVHGTVARVDVEDGSVVGLEVERDGVVQGMKASCVVCAVRGHEAARMLGSLPELAGRLDALEYSSVVLANLHLDCALEGEEWVWVHSREAGHRAAFAVDLLRRAPEMFAQGRSVLQVDFASPVSDAMLELSDGDIVDQAIADMEDFLPGVGARVRATSVVRRPQVIPSFAVGTFGQARVLQREAERTRGLHLAGDYLRVPLCEGAVRSATTLVEHLVGSSTPIDQQIAAAS